MTNLYYEIWVDAIVYEKTRNGDKRNWKIYTLVPISILQGINLLTILFWLVFLTIKFDPFLHFNIFPGKIINSFMSGFITLFLPFLILNYLLIFRKNKYDTLLIRYDYKKGKYYIIYFITSIGIFLLPIIIGKWIIPLFV